MKCNGTALRRVTITRRAGPCRRAITRGSAIWHKGIGLRLRGWACNGGNAPWDSGPTANWGGDHGVPCAAAAAGDKVFLGWSGAEAGSALLGCDLQGRVQWKNNRQGMAGAEFVAADGNLVYAVNWGAGNSNYVYRLHAADGSYASYPDNSPDIFPAQVFGQAAGGPTRVEGLAARNGKLYLSIDSAGKTNTIAVVDAQTRKLLNAWHVVSPRLLYAVSDKLVYVVCGGTTVLALDATTGQTQAVVTNLHNARGITVDQAGQIYVGVGNPQNQVKVFDPAGNLLRHRPARRPPPDRPLAAGRPGLHRRTGRGRRGHAVGYGGRPVAKARQRMGRPEREVRPRVLRLDLLRGPGRCDQPAGPLPHGRPRLRVADRPAHRPRRVPGLLRAQRHVEFPLRHRQQRQAVPRGGLGLGLRQLGGQDLRARRRRGLQAPRQLPVSRQG